MTKLVPYQRLFQEYCDDYVQQLNESFFRRTINGLKILKAKLLSEPPGGMTHGELMKQFIPVLDLISNMYSASKKPSKENEEHNREIVKEYLPKIAKAAGLTGIIIRLPNPPEKFFYELSSTGTWLSSDHVALKKVIKKYAT